MRGNGCWWLRLVLAAAWWFVSAPRGARADDPPTGPSTSARQSASPTSRAPVHLFLKDPGDLNDLISRLARPDFVILRGDDYARLVNPPDAPTPTTPWAQTVTAVAVSGSVVKDLADLSVDFTVELAVEGPVAVDLRLDGLTLTSVVEDDRVLPARVGQEGRWQVDLTGRGAHQLRARLLAPARPTPEGKRIELAIPEAASTRLAIELDARIRSASTNVDEPVARVLDARSGRTRLQADLTPRSLLALSWKDEADHAAALPPLLVSRSEIAVDVDSGWFRTHSSWMIRSVRGVASELRFQLDPDDEVLEIELDGQTPPAGTERAGGSVRLTIPLAEPLAPGRERRLVMNTRRPLPPGSSTRIAFRGFSLENAREQSGVIGIAVPGYLWLSGTAGRGARPIDPRTELPTDLRARPTTALAYQFTEQPFELSLRIEPSPPHIRAEARTTVTLSPSSAHLDSWFDYQAARGRIGDLMLGLPPGLEILAVGPDDLVESWQVSAITAGPFTGVVPSGLRVLTIRLDPRARDTGKTSVHVSGRQPLHLPTREVPLPLMQPLNVVAGGGRVAVLTDPALTAELADRGDASAGVGPFRPAVQAIPSDWPWPSGRPPVATPPLWLRFDDRPTDLPLLVTSHPRTMTQATVLKAHISRTSADVQQETECSVQFGAIDHIDLTVPAAIADHWEVESTAIAQRIDLGMTSEGGRAARLRLTNDASRSARLKFRYRLPVNAEAGDTELAVPWIRVEGTTGPAPVRASISAEPDMNVESAGEDWSSDPMASTNGDGASQGLNLAAPAGDLGHQPLRLRVSSRRLAVLPTLVAPRLALRTTQDPRGDLLTTAWYWVESHDTTFRFALPTSASLTRVQVASEPINQVEELPGGSGYRVMFPARVESAPVLVELEYRIPATAVRDAWTPPRLLSGEVVQQTFWEVRVPWNRAVVGVPSGWSDENEWYWDNYVWKRRPWLAPGALLGWVVGEPERSPRDAAAAAEGDPRNDYHSYLFGRPGNPSDLAVTSASRALLVAICSGTVLALGGLLILVWRPAIGLVGVAILGLSVSIAALLFPSLCLQALQSGEIGLGLAALIVVLQRFVDRGQPAGVTIYGEPSSRPPVLAAGSTQSHTVGTGAGSDESTMIRVRTASTRDHIQIAPVPPPPSAPNPVVREERPGFGDFGP